MDAELPGKLRQNHVDVALNVFSAPPIDKDVLLSQRSLTIAIPRSDIWIAMDSAIYLHGKHHLLAEKVHDEAADRVLPHEL